MAIEAQTGLEPVIEQEIETIKENTAAVRVTNALLLGSQMQLDLTKPQDVEKVLRYLPQLENHIGGASND